MSSPNVSLSKTKEEVKELLSANPFGLLVWARRIVTQDDAFAFAVHMGLINIDKPPKCKCGRVKYLTGRTDRADAVGLGLEWMCHTEMGNRCRIRKSILANTWFHGTKISMLTALELAIHWFYETPVTLAAGQLGVASATAIDWYNYCRQVCFTVVNDLDICIGGPGLHVEIDESHLWTRKYHRGRGSARDGTFVELVPDRSGNTLWPIIMHFFGSLNLNESGCDGILHCNRTNLLLVIVIHVVAKALVTLPGMSL